MCRGHSTLPATDLNSAKDSKHKISFLLQKPEPQAGDQKPIKEKTTSASSSSFSSSSFSSTSFSSSFSSSSSSSAAAAKSMPTPSQVKKWKESFSHVMSSQSQLRCCDPRGNEVEPPEHLPILFQRRSKDDLHLDGERLLQALSQLQTDPKSASERDEWCSEEEGTVRGTSRR